MKIKINQSNETEYYTTAERFYRNEISKTAERVGGREKLSILLGFQKSYITAKLSRSYTDLTALRKVYLRIILILNKKEYKSNLNKFGNE